MCGYDPIGWYEEQMEMYYEAYDAGYESVEEYHNAIESQQENDDYDRYADDKVEQMAKDEDLDVPF